ncbi:MAG TPA: PQQ-binding-like beta-propeller repeat protein [Prolixibacteraceae bacterium]
MKIISLISLILLLICGFAGAQTVNNDYKLPGKGLKQHDFLYAGEWDMRKPQAQSLFLVRNGKVVWQYSIPLRTATGGVQEFDDATLLSNGNIVYACMSGAGIITPEKNIIWQFICPPGTETHSCQPIGKDSVLMVLNGFPGKVLIFNTSTNTLLKEIIIPTTSTSTHGQFRHVRMTKNKTIMVGLFAEQKVVEFDLDGKEVWSVNAPSAWSAIRLHNGNTLISGDGKGYTREVNQKGETVWEFTRADAPFTIGNTQTASRLANGNTVICNWIAGNNKTEEWAGTVQVFEVTPDKKIVWALSSWDKPDLGPSTSIQLLDEPGNPDNGELQR